MDKWGLLCGIILVSVLVFASTCSTGARAQTEDMENFLDSEFPGLHMQVNATTEALPKENVTVILQFTAQANVSISYFNLDIYGFLNGSDRLLMANINDNDLLLDNEAKTYSRSFQVHEQVWGVTYGEVSLTYSADFGVFNLVFPDLVNGFTMTNVRSVYLENLEGELTSLSERYRQLNATYWQLFQNYTSLQASLSELDATRTAIAVAAVAAVFFAVTTVYLLVRRPKQQW